MDLRSFHPRIVILGAGFGGLFAAQSMARMKAHITLVDRHNYHLFQPLLYQVATAGLPPSDISWPVRSILNRQANVSVLMDEVMDVDTDGHRVVLRGGEVAYDYLIVATGSRPFYFGHDDWIAVAPGLKSIDDATLIRRRITLSLYLYVFIIIYTKYTSYIPPSEPDTRWQHISERLPRYDSNV